MVFQITLYKRMFYIMAANSSKSKTMFPDATRAMSCPQVAAFVVVVVS